MTELTMGKTSVAEINNGRNDIEAETNKGPTGCHGYVAETS